MKMQHGRVYTTASVVIAIIVLLFTTLRAEDNPGILRSTAVRFHGNCSYNVQLYLKTIWWSTSYDIGCRNALHDRTAPESGFTE